MPDPVIIKDPIIRGKEEMPEDPNEPIVPVEPPIEEPTVEDEDEDKEGE